MCLALKATFRVEPKVAEPSKTSKARVGGAQGYHLDHQTEKSQTQFRPKHRSTVAHGTQELSVHSRVSLLAQSCRHGAAPQWKPSICGLSAGLHPRPGSIQGDVCTGVLHSSLQEERLNEASSVFWDTREGAYLWVWRGCRPQRMAEVVRAPSMRHVAGLSCHPACQPHEITGCNRK